MPNRPNASEKKIIVVYKILKSLNKTSKQLHVSKEYIRKVLKEAGIKQYNLPRAGKIGVTYTRDCKSKFIAWVKDHPDVVLPRDDTKLAELTGINKSAIKMLLHRRKKKISAYVNAVIKSTLDTVNCDLQNYHEDLSYAIYLEETFKDFLSGQFNIYIDKYTTEIKVKISDTEVFIYKDVTDFKNFIEDIRLIFYNTPE